MNEIDLVDAVAAARRVADTAASDGIATRRRIRASLEQKRNGRARRITIIGGIMATLFGSTAFAYYRTPWRHPSTPSTVVPAPAIVDTVDIEPPHIREHSVVAERPAPPPAPPTPTVEVALPPPPAPAAQPDPELAAYRLAYDAHFHGGSPATALAAWDAYLAAYPDGKLAIDARYNRAIMLVKLKRWSEAEAALRPLAEGTYRRAEAARLLQALPH